MEVDKVDRIEVFVSLERELEVNRLGLYLQVYLHKATICTSL